MYKNLNIQELAIVVVARNHNPTILNPDFLKYNSIVPDAWELAENPVCTDVVARVRYKNGISILAQFERVAFSEGIGVMSPEEARVPGIAAKYVGTLPHVDYRAVGINIKGCVVVDSEEETHRFILDKLIAPGPWKTFQDKPPGVSVRFLYPMNNKLLNLTIESGLLPQADGTQLPAVMFESNFHQDITDKASEEKVDTVQQIIDSWKTDVETFRKLINGIFLGVEKEG